MARHGPDKDICGAQRANQPEGVVCQNVAGERTDHLGIGRCYRHGGSTESHNKAARVEILDRDARKLLAIEGFEPIVDPFTELSELAGEVKKLKNVLRDKVEELTNLKDVGGKNVATQIDVLFQAYERSIDRCERILMGMARLDLEDRIARLHARIDSDTADQIVSAMTASLEGVDISDAVREAIILDFGTRLSGGQQPGRQQAVGAIG